MCNTSSGYWVKPNSLSYLFNCRGLHCGNFFPGFDEQEGMKVKKVTFLALDYLVSKKSNITVVRMVLSEGVTALPAAEFLCKCRCVLYVGQGGGAGYIAK